VRDDAPRTVPELLFDAAARFGDAVAIRDDTAPAHATTYTFGGLADAAAQAAAAFATRGVRPGDRIGMWAPNTAEWIVAALGAACAGAVLVPLNTRAKGEEAAILLARAECRLLLTSRGFLGADYPAMLDSSGIRLDDLRDVVLLRGEPTGRAVAWSELVEAGGERRLVLPVAPDDISHVQFTSGTTGAPKGAMLRHHALCGTTRQWVDNVGLVEGDRYCIVSPFFHVSGHKTGVLACLTAGATMFPHAIFDPVEVMARVARERITVLPGPPTIYQTLLAHPRRAEFDLGSLRLAVTGAASIPPVLVERMVHELGFRNVITAYGITETTGVVTMCRPGDPLDLVAESAGRSVDGVELRIADAAGRALPAGETGEILVRGEGVMAGYLDDPDATRAAIDPDGWFHSGDVGWVDEAGNLRITDRLGDVFIVGGFNAYPAEIEAMLARHPAVAQVAVIGEPDERLGEVGCAFVVLRPGAAEGHVDGPDEDVAASILGWCRARMANYKTPRRVLLVDSLPQNASGKVLKHELRALAARAR
jgi:acyl-CoA synthetase (AMP-forming)/AMP-acid ligase II